MRTKTSFFNKKIFFKNIYQALPIILIMTGFLTLLSVNCATEIFNEFRKDYTTEYINQMIHYNLYDYTSTVFVKFILAVYSFFCGIFVFRYLYQKKICTTLHALPLTRTCLYLTNVVSGFVILIIPAILSAVIFCVFLLVNGYAIAFLPLWLLIVAAFCLIFYALSILTAMLTGHLLAAPIIYFFLNSGIIITQYLISMFISIAFFGVDSEPSSDSLIFTPFIYLHEKLHITDSEKVVYSDQAYRALIIYAIAAIVILIISCFLYRSRNLEMQGNPIAAKKLQPIFLYFGTFFAGTISSLILYQILSFDTSSWYSASREEFVFLIVLFLLCSVISYFVIMMLLHKTIRVFKHTYKGILAFCGISCLFFLLVMLDIFGVVGRIPKTADIDSIYFSFLDTPLNIKDNEEMFEKITDIHQTILDKRDTLTDHDYFDSSCSWLNITYKQKNGKILLRRYWIPVSDLNQSGSPSGQPYEIADSCIKLMQEKSLMEHALEEAYTFLVDINILKHEVTDEESTIDTVNVTVTDYKNIYEALKKDLSAGVLSYYNDYIGVESDASSKALYTVDLFPDYSNMDDTEEHDQFYRYGSFSYAITAECTNTLKVIKQLEETDTTHNYEKADTEMN